MEENQDYLKEFWEQGQWLFKQECLFIRGVVSLDDLPDFHLPEIAFAGRSNVGKSSLINGLTNRLTLTRTSHTPGRTQQLNFFSLKDKLLLVDMPGYGYAEASKSAIKSWQKLIKQYLRGRPSLKRVYLLIDSRHGIKLNDIETMELLDETAVSYQIVLTKMDKLKENEQKDVHLKTINILKKHPAAHPYVVMTSSHDKIGLESLRAEIAQFAIL